jgi:hypothetical protein
VGGGERWREMERDMERERDGGSERKRASKRGRVWGSARPGGWVGGRDLVELEGGHVGDVARCRGLLVLVYVHLEKLTLIHTGHLGNLGRDRFARPAPGRGEVHTYQLPAAPGFRGTRVFVRNGHTRNFVRGTPRYLQPNCGGARPRKRSTAHFTDT